MYIILVTLSNSDKTWRTYNKKEDAIAFAKIWDRPFESAEVYEVNNSTPIFNT